MPKVQVRSMARAALTKGGEVGPALRGTAVDLARRGPVTHVVVVRPSSVDLIDPTPLRQGGVPTAHHVAGFANTRTAHGEAEALGLIGRARSHPDEAEHVMVFLEWPDDRWWWWRGEMGRPIAEGVVRDARLGDPMPDGLGRWWLLARREGLHVALRREGEGVVH